MCPIILIFTLLLTRGKLSSVIFCLIWCFLTEDITNKFQTNMVSIQEMLIGNVKEETEEKIDIEHGFPHITSSDEDHTPK